MMGRIGSTKLVLPKWHKYGTYNRHLRVDGKKLARNGPKTATYYSASFPPHYRRVLISNLLVFNLCVKFGFCFQPSHVDCKTHR